MKWAGRQLYRASLENPSTPLDDPDDWLYDALGAAPSTSGVRVNRETALTYSPYWRGINLISRDVGKLPLGVYKREGDGKVRATDHRAFRLLRYKPNSEMTAFVFKQTLQSHALSEGNGLAYIFRSGDATPLELIPLLPGKAWPVRVNGRLWYVVDVNGEQRKLPPEDVFHIKGLSFDGLTGYPLHCKAKNSLGLGMAAEEFGARYFKNGGEPAIVLEHPGKLSDTAIRHLRESWNQMHSGLNNAHKAAILEDGLKVNAFGNNARQSQLLETRQFQIIDVANWLGVPPHKLGDTSRQGYNSLEQEEQSYLNDALDPWLVNWEEECREKLLTEEEKLNDTHVVEFNRAALLRADMAARGEFYMKATGNHPWMTVNEVRARENLNPIEGFSVIKTPTNNFGPEPDATVNDEGDERAAIPAETLTATRAVLVDAAKRMARRLVTHARKAQKGGTLAQWLADVAVADHRDVLIEALSPAVSVASSITGRKSTAADAADLMIGDLQTRIAEARDSATHETIFSDYEVAAPEKLATRLVGAATEQQLAEIDLAERFKKVESQLKETGETIARQKPPVVNVHPAAVTVQPPAVTVNQAAITVEAPIIQVPEPKPKRSKRSIERDEKGRIKRIVEEPE